MAQQDYFSKIGGQYGQLAGSILSDKRRRKKKGAFTALVVQTFIETLGAKNRQLAQGLKDSIDNLTEDNKIGTISRQYQWQEEAEGRAKYKNYLKNPKLAIQEYAKKLYNEDPGIDKHGITFNDRGKLTGDAKVIDEMLWQQKLKDSENHHISLGDDPLTNEPTFASYNQAYVNEHRSALQRIKDDPTKKGAIRNLINKKFPKRYNGLITELDVALEDSKNEVKFQEQVRPVRVKAERAFTIEEAKNKVVSLYGNKLSEETTQEILDMLNNKKGILGVTENDILGMAISTQVLNRDNLDSVTKEVAVATQLYDAGFKRKYPDLTELPPSSKEAPKLFKTYTDGLSDYLDINVFKVDPLTSKVNNYLNIIEDPKSPIELVNIAKASLRDMGKDSNMDAIIRGNLGAFADPLRLAEINQTIDAEKENDNPRYTTLEEYFAYITAQQKTILDSLYEQQEEE